MGDSITEGKILEINKSQGDYVEADEIVALIETDKTSLEIRSPKEGFIGKFLQNVDDIVKVDAPLFELDTTKRQTPKKESKVEVVIEKSNKTTEIEKIPEKPAQEHENVAQQPKQEIKPKKTPTRLHQTFSERQERSVPLSMMRLKIAQRLKESQNTAASLTTFNNIDCSAILNMKNKYKDSFMKTSGTKLGLMSPFVRAATLALLRFPEINAYFDLENKQIILHDYVDISVAVAGPKGLVVPVIRDTNKLTFAQIETAIKDFAAQAKENNLKVEDMQGGTFTISNSGVFKSMVGTPIINPPQSAVLGIYGIFDTPVAIEGEVKIRPVMQVALTYDHRIVDGREAVLFLRAIKEYIEDPVTMNFY